jgi:hypothetical protein
MVNGWRAIKSKAEIGKAESGKHGGNAETLKG